MSKKTEQEAVETQVVETAQVVETTEKKKPGRPVMEGSKRQERLAAQAAKVAGGGVIAKGRPANPNSARQLKLKEKAEMIAKGITVKVGRPKMEKVEQPVAEVVEA